jgi:hypothetical protein
MANDPFFLAELHLLTNPIRIIHSAALTPRLQFSLQPVPISGFSFLFSAAAPLTREVFHLLHGARIPTPDIA